MNYPGSVANVGLVNGKFVNEDPVSGVVGSLIPAEWGNSVTDELLAVITAAGLTPSEGNLAQLLSAIRIINQADATQYSLDTGTASAYKAAYSPAVPAVVDGMVLRFKAKTANTGPCTFSPNDIAPAPMYSSAHVPLQGGEIAAGGDVWVQWNTSIGGGTWIIIASTAGGATASAAEAAAGTNNTKWMSPLRVAQAIAAMVVQAGETVFGVAKIATQALTNAGADDTTFVTPKKLRLGVAFSFGTNGYISLPQWAGGWTLQWGNSSSISTTGTSVTFPISFPTACRVVMATGSNSNSVSINAYSWTTAGTGLQANSASGGPYSGSWLALGN